MNEFSPLKAQQIIARVAALGANERESAVLQLCGDDAELLAEVRRLLGAALESGAVADSPTVTADLHDAPTSDARPDIRLEHAFVAEGPGAQIGPYRLLELIGEGGFGSVFMAEQDKPVKRKVALKIIKLGMDTRQVVARFEQERQALALMDHPHIAKVFDAGTTRTGRPYFVMEFCNGEPITGYCDRNNLSIPARFSLFVQVCEAVQHAHQKGLIHRDIKPSNVLVSDVDGRPHAKVIDFGIAKATASKLTEQTLFTEQAQMIGTPQYMSPEQAEGNLDIDTRTDVYALGVLLYELLTGTTPFDSRSLRKAAYAEMQRIIREVEPPRPSTRLVLNTDMAASIAAQRQTEPRRLESIIRGELDWIVMKALEKDRQRRYQTANGLAMDIRRYLAGEAVLAAPPSRVYRARKFVKRNRVLVTAGGMVALALVLGLIGTAYGLRQEAAATRVAQSETDRARREAARAVKAEAEAKARAEELQLVSDFQAGILRQIDPTQAGKELTQDVNDKFAAALAKASPAFSAGERATMINSFKNQWERINATDAARELIDRTLLKPAITAIDNQFKGKPLVDAQLRQALAARYMDLGFYDRAMPLLNSVLANRRRVLGDDDLATINTVEHVGWVLQSQGHFAEAEPYVREGMERRRRIEGEEDPSTLRSMSNLGDLYREMGRLPEAELMLGSALEKMRRVLGNENLGTLAAMNTLGQVYVLQKKLAETEKLWREAYETGRRVLGEDDRHVLVWAANLAGIYVDQNKLAEAEPLRRESLARARRILGEEHPDTLGFVNLMGKLLEREHKFDEAEPYLREALEKRRRVLGPNHRSTLDSMDNLAYLFEDQEKYAEAESLLRDALEKRRRLFPARDPDILVNLGDLAKLLDVMNKPADAEPLARELLDARVALLPPGSFRIGMVRSFVGGSVLAQNKFAEAEPLLLDGYANLIAAKDSPPQPFPVLRDAGGRLVKLYELWEKSEPGKGHGAKASEWKAKLEKLSASTRPGTTRASN